MSSNCSFVAFRISLVICVQHVFTKFCLGQTGALSGRVTFVILMVRKFFSVHNKDHLPTKRL